MRREGMKRKRESYNSREGAVKDRNNTLIRRALHTAKKIKRYKKKRGQNP
jgi:hypothetical protein